MQIDFGEPQMSVPLPDGIAVRTIVPGKDDIELVTAYRETFADHYGILRQPFGMDLKEWRHLMGKGNFDASLWFLAIDTTEDAAIVGFCVCHPASPGYPEHGLINDLGVRPAWRRRGLGRALLLHAFDELASRGIQGAVLNVDTKNKSGAPALYERVGMRSIHATLTYVKELRSGVNLVPQ